MYVERYKRETHPEDKKKLISFILGFLRKYARSSQVDFARILDAIPDDLPVTQYSMSDPNLNQELDNEATFSFLSSVTSHILHQKRTYACTRELSEIDLINAKAKFYEAR